MADRPIDLAAGSECELIFLAAHATSATSSDISTHNSFVQTEAALNSIASLRRWHAVDSTAIVNAGDHALTVVVDGSCLPVYNTPAIEVSGAAGLYSASSWLSPVGYDQYETSSAHRYAFTGSVYTGSAEPGHFLGAEMLNPQSVRVGDAVAIGGEWPFSIPRRGRSSLRAVQNAVCVMRNGQRPLASVSLLHHCCAISRKRAPA